MRVFVKFFLIMSCFVLASPSYGKQNKVKKFEGKIEIIKSQNDQELFLLSDSKSKKLYILDVSSNFVGVARLMKGKKVTVKGVLFKTNPQEQHFDGMIKVKNIAPY